MRSIFELISKYKSDVIIVPILAFAAFIVTLFMYIFLNKKKINKYFPGFVTLAIGLVLFILGWVNILEIQGLNYIEIGSKFLIFAFIAIIFSLIFDTFDSLGKNTKQIFKKDKASKKKKVSKSK